MKRLGLALAACLSASVCQAENLRLTCIIEDAASFDARDPIASIALAVEGERWTIVHKAQSGATFDRGQQYYIRADARAPAWRGMSLKRPHQSMTGEVRPLRPGAWTYEERLFDERRGGRQTYWMRALCTPAPAEASASPARAAAPREGAPLRQWSNDLGRKTYDIDGVSVAIEPIKDKDGEPIARIELRMAGVKPLTMETETGLSNAAVSFDVLNLDPKHARKDFLVSWFTGGAHCCAQIKVASLVGEDWKIIDLGMWDGGRLENRPIDLNGDGVPDFVFRDNNFLYAFGSYAESAAPSLILNIENGARINRSDNPGFVSLFREEMAENEPECRKGSNPACAAFVAAAARAGEFERAWRVMLAHHNRKPDWDITICGGPSDGCDKEKTTRSLPEALPTFLRRTGYMK